MCSAADEEGSAALVQAIRCTEGKGLGGGGGAHVIGAFPLPALATLELVGGGFFGGTPLRIPKCMLPDFLVVSLAGI